MKIRTEAVERHTLSVLVDNEPGILARIAGMFTARGYNIESLTVTNVSEDETISRITIVTAGSSHVIHQIITQTERMPPVYKVTDTGPHVERDMALVKVAGTGDNRIEALQLADVYRAQVVDSTTSSFVFEVTGSSNKVDNFIELMREVGLIEVARTGVVAIGRGKEMSY